tara:strand:- start:2389 stop:4161 length:1773 start_codon:yes stop_codon:yes gene_type:complete
MSESAKPFDVHEVSEEIIQHSDGGQLLNWLAQNRLFRRDEFYQAFCECLVTLHNAQRINLISAVVSEQFEPTEGRDFWLLQDLICTLIPKLRGNADDMMEAVEKLVGLGGEDMAANQPNAALREWLVAQPAEVEELLRKAQQEPHCELPALTFILEAGARHDLNRYHEAAIDFLEYDSVATRRAAVTALSRIDVSGCSFSQNKSLEALIAFANSTSSGEDFGSAIGALLDVHARQPCINAANVTSIIVASGARPNPGLHYFLARALGNYHDRFSVDLQNAIIQVLSSADPSMKGVVDQIDFAFARCFSKRNRLEVAACLEALFNHEEAPLNLRDLDSFLHALTTEHEEHMNWLVVHWLRFGSHFARLQLAKIFTRFSEEGYELTPTMAEFAFCDQELIFVSRKALGYFITEASTAASIVISCLRATTDPKASETIAGLLYDPLMINFSGKARETIDRHSKMKGSHQKRLKAALKAHDEYLDGLRAVGEIPELRPSSSQLRVESERQRKQSAQIAKEAEKLSIFANLVTRQTILFGQGSIDYIRNPNGTMRRSVTMLSSFGTTMEIPRLNVIDPLYLQHIVLNFRREKFSR